MLEKLELQILSPTFEISVREKSKYEVPKKAPIH